MKVITGKMFNTSLGKIIVHNEQNETVLAGDSVVFEGNTYKVRDIVAPTKPDGKWALSV